MNVVVFSDIQGSLINDDGDGNENGKKVIGLDWQNNNFARASRFFVHSFPFTALFLISGFMEDVNIRQRFFFFL